MTIEDKIRDFLANDLSFLENGLTVIKKEYYLPNHFGSKGYIDILARDIFNNFVIIEIKRSQASSREAIQEILKYVGLIKQSFKARDGEIRIIIVSTHWDELIVPFSELSYQTSLTVKGIHLFVDNGNIPKSQKEILPIKPPEIKRKFSKTYFLYLSYTQSNRQRCYNYITQRAKQIGINDYVLVSLTCDIKKLPQVLYPYAICFAFQSASIKEYDVIIKAGGQEIDMDEGDFESLEEYKDYLEQILTIALNKERYHDSAESCCPEKLDNAIVRGNWTVDNIYRFGIFNSDPRYVDELLLRELRGLDGSSAVKYLNFTESIQHDRLLEIEENCITPIENNSIWKEHIESIFKFLKSQNEKYRLIVHIYSPRSVFESVCCTYIDQEHEFLPMYLIFVDFLDTNKLFVFNGRLAWTGEQVNLSNNIAFLEDNANTLVNRFIDCILGHFEEEVLMQWNLQYENSLDIYENGNLVNEGQISIISNNIEFINSKNQSFYDWSRENQTLVDILVQGYLANTFGS